MEELKFRNSVCTIIYGACFITIVVILSCIICIAIPYFVEKICYFKLISIIGALVILFVWIFAFIAILTSKKILVTKNDIKMVHGKKVIWCIRKEEILECIYNGSKWYNVIDPFSLINAYVLQFKMKQNYKISKYYCSLSQKQVNKLKTEFDYPIREINSIREQ